MWSLVLIALVSSASSSGQRQRSSRQQGPGWDIRLAVPGEPGADYPTLDGIPKTSFSCAGKTPGYYADFETNCQVFRVCTAGSTYGFQSFLCPNGTLFNQAVFVCDWWMHVNCDSSQQPAPTANPQFDNLRLGPQLMNDVKKMLTHPMRNPYDKSTMRSNLIVMQEYRPPPGQMFGNAFGPKQNQISNVYVPAKQLEEPYGPNGNSFSDSFVAGSTPSPLYSTSLFSNGQSLQRDIEVFQRQRQNGQYVQQQQNSNTQNGQYANTDNYRNSQQQNQQNEQFINTFNRQNSQYQNKPFTAFANHQGAGKKIQQQYSQYTNEPRQSNHNYNNQGSAQFSQQVSLRNTQNQINHQRGQVKHNSQYSGTQSKQGKQTQYGISYTKQQYDTNHLNQAELPQFSNQVTGSVGNEAKQNLVSNTPSATVIAKTLTFNRIIQEPKSGGPKSRITFKTWIVKPKNSKLVAEPTPYTYDRPTTPLDTAKLVASPTAYYYSKPTTTQAAKLISEPESYYYNPPTQAVKLVSESGYTFNKPATPEKQVEVTGYIYNKPTTPEKQIITTVPTLPARLYLTPSSAPPPTVPSRLYLAATTFKPLARLYIPPSSNPPELSRQYLNPSAQNSYYEENAKLQASPTTPTPVIVPAPDEKSTYSVIKHSRINTNHNNLTFTDILTKEKLDITVNDIVKDTKTILGTASTQQGQEEEAEEYPDEENDTTSTAYTESGENLSPATPTVEVSKSSRLVVKPASDLEPPDESFESDNQNSNRLAALPFYKEPNGSTNTIERTVSLKISIPERTAAYLFNTSSDSSHDKLEILNTGSSNYLVLTNKLQNSAPSFIPIGKLIVDKNSNISNSQALVFSFLADSINQVKEYKNLAQENRLTSTSQSEFQTINHEDLAGITDKVAQLTSAQFTANNNKHLNQLTSTTQRTKTGNLAATHTNNFPQNKERHSPSAQINAAPQQSTRSGQYYSSQFQGGGNSLNGIAHNNNEQLYSGQLYQVPVPDVARIYNGQTSAKLINNNIQQQNSEVDDLHQNTNNNNLLKQSSTEVEVVQSHSLSRPAPSPAPAKLQAAPQSFTSQEDTHSLLGNFVNTGNGISAQLRDKIVGTITHPTHENKLVTYKKDQSYYVFTKLDDIQENLINAQSVKYAHNNAAPNAKLTQGNNVDNTVTFQFIPSVGYQLEDEKEQQKLLNAFNIDDFGNPRSTGGLSGTAYQRGSAILTSNVDYTVQHTPSSKQNVQYNSPSNLYAGPSSYSAPQSSVGRLEAQQIAGPYQNINPNSAKLELEDSNQNGYRGGVPARTFTF